MHGSPFETRYPTLLHLLIVGAAWATYLFDRDDIVWRMIRDFPSRRMFEHVLFSLATIPHRDRRRPMHTGTRFDAQPRGE